MVKVLALEGNKIKLCRKAVLKEQREKMKKEQVTQPQSSKIFRDQRRDVNQASRLCRFPTG